MTAHGIQKILSCSAPLLDRNSRNDLRFKRILTTCPQQYQDRLASTIVRYGGRPVWIPGIKIQELRSESLKRRRKLSLEKLGEISFIVLPSKNAIFSCVRACGGSITAFQEILNGNQHIQIWAMGADADYLREELGIRNVKKPVISSTDGIIDAMKHQSTQSGNALVFVPELVPPLTEPDVVPNFLQNLQNIGIVPLRVPAYETSIGLSLHEVEPEIEMLINGSIHAIAFTSTAESEGLCHIVGKTRLIQLIESRGVLIAAHGSTTAKGVSKMLGYRGQICVSKDSSTFEGMVSAIAERLKS